MGTRPLNIRRGVLGGGVVAVISAAGAAGRSTDPLATFAGFLVVGLVAIGLATLLVVTIKRRSQPPIRW